MRWTKVAIEAVGYELPGETVTSDAIEARLRSVYDELRVAPGQVAAWTGVRERRVWPEGTLMRDVAARAAAKALDRAGLSGDDLGAVVYAGVCRDDLEPATSCAVAHAVGASPDALVYDVSNACLGALNAMLDVANRIELGQIRAGLVVAAESSRAIVSSTIERLVRDPTLDRYRLALATMTGGSAAVAVVLTAAEISDAGHRLVAAAAQSAPEHHRLCRWGPSRGLLGETVNVMETNAAEVLEHGVTLGRRTWDRLLASSGLRAEDFDRVICHQVGAAHRRAVLEALGVSVDKDFSTFETLGNTGTVSVPITAALAEEAGFLRRGDRVAWLGIGSGLNCLMLAIEW